MKIEQDNTGTIVRVDNSFVWDFQYSTSQTIVNVYEKYDIKTGILQNYTHNEIAYETTDKQVVRSVTYNQYYLHNSTITLGTEGDIIDNTEFNTDTIPDDNESQDNGQNSVNRSLSLGSTIIWSTIMTLATFSQIRQNRKL